MSKSQLNDSIIRTSLNEGLKISFSDDVQSRLKKIEIRVGEIQQLANEPGISLDEITKLQKEANTLSDEANELKESSLKGQTSYIQSFQKLSDGCVTSLKSGKLEVPDLGINLTLSASSPIRVESVGHYSLHCASLNILRVTLATLKVVRTDSNKTDAQLVADINGLLSRVLYDLDKAVSTGKYIASPALPATGATLPRFKRDKDELLAVRFVIQNFGDALALVGSTAITQSNNMLSAMLRGSLPQLSDDSLFSVSARDDLITKDGSTTTNNLIYEILGLVNGEASAYEVGLIESFLNGSIFSMKEIYGSVITDKSFTDLTYKVDNINVDRLVKFAKDIIDVTFCLVRGRLPMSVEVGTNQLYAL